MSPPLNFGIVGAGYIADVIASAIQNIDGARLAAVASRRLARAEAFAQKHGIERVFDSYQELAAWQGIDAVYAATPTAAREAVCLEAARNGKHLLAEKPFASLSSLQSITRACRQHGAAFMDATHFPHHPRTRQLKQEMAARIGRPGALRACFYFPSVNDGSNIRYDPQQEPAGAIGDMAWYALRAAAEFLPAGAVLIQANGCTRRDAASGAVIQGAGVLGFSDGSTCTWDVGYNCGACVMDLDILGPLGMISLDDFVLDWASGFFINSPDYPVGFNQRLGLVSPAGFTRVETPSQKPQTVHMLQDFIALVCDPQGEAARQSMEVTERTQKLLDAVLGELEVRG